MHWWTKGHGAGPVECLGLLASELYQLADASPGGHGLPTPACASLRYHGHGASAEQAARRFARNVDAGVIHLDDIKGICVRDSFDL